MPVISVSLPSEDLDAFDDLVEHMGYESRSSAVRDALYNWVAQHRLDLEGDEIGLVLTLVYAADHGQARVQEIVHEEEHLVQTSLHQHVGQTCVDLVVLHGDGDEVHRVLDQLTSIRDVRVNATPL